VLLKQNQSESIFMVKIEGLPWSKVNGFHMDDYIDLPKDHRASFLRYLKANLTERVAMKSFLPMDGNAADVERTCSEYAAALRSADPQLCLLGIGENGHLAFNDPGEADFNDPREVKVVTLDQPCREQQASEGWFERFEDVPEHALTLTMPTLFRVPKIIVSISGKRKAHIGLCWIQYQRLARLRFCALIPIRRFTSMRQLPVRYGTL
jgi:glucosamine-6-phosphate deaminase